MLNKSFLHQVMASFFQSGFRFIETTLAAKNIFNLSECNPVVILINQIMADDDKDHPVVAAVDFKPAQLTGEGEMSVCVKEFLQLMIQLSRSDGIVIQVLEIIVQPVKEFVDIQTGLFRWFWDIIVLECPDDGSGDIERVLILGVVEFQIPCPDESIQFIAILQRSDITDIQMPGNVIVIYVPGAVTQTDGKQYRLQRGNVQP